MYIYIYVYVYFYINIYIYIYISINCYYQESANRAKAALNYNSQKNDLAALTDSPYSPPKKVYYVCIYGLIYMYIRILI
jgi:hypothetical protein